MASGSKDLEEGRDECARTEKESCSLASEDVVWRSVSSEVDRKNDGSKNIPCGEVRDRSLSYLDINFREPCNRSKPFESVRKFGRPRQQISDVLDFLDSSLGGDGRKYYQKERYHFGQCLILPKVSTLPPKGNTARQKKLNSPRANTNPFGIKNYEQKTHAVSSFSEKISSCEVSDYELKNKMYRWTEEVNENHPNKSTHESWREENKNLTLKINERTANKKELYDFYQEDIEAQLDSRSEREARNNSDLKDEYYRQDTLDSRRNIDELEVRVSDVRENWRLRIMKEIEEKQRAIERKKNGPKTDEDDGEIWVKPVWKNWEIREERPNKELHRSKSTPDMLDGVGKRQLEVWTFEEEPKKNRSTIDFRSRNWSDSVKTAYANGNDYYCPSSNFYEKVYNDQQEADSLNEPNLQQERFSSPELPGGEKNRNTQTSSGKNFFGQFLNSRGVTPTEMFSNAEPFSQFWVCLSNIYGQALVILMFAFSLTEVMDNSVKLLSLQGIFLVYLYVGSIAVIICIYIWVLIDSCSSIQKSDTPGLVPPTITTSIIQDRDAELQNLSPTKFGSLKKAHISRERTSSTSFYLRIGAIAFGLGTLVFNGLEMAMHSMMESSCLNDVVFVHPILHGLFTFLQMHFLFVNSQVLVERFGLTARFGFMHLAATNLALWIRLVIWESGNEWTYYVHLSQHENNYPSTDIPTPLQLRGFPKFITRKERELDLGTSENSFYQAISKEHISQVISLHQCLNTNSLGQLWTSSMPFLYPFIIQFSLIAAAVTYIMGQNVAKDRLFFQKKIGTTDKNHSLLSIQNSVNVWNVDCGGASKGLFLGILCLVAGVVVIIIFLVVKENKDFPPETIFWLTMGMLLTILSVTVLMNIVGLVQVRKLSVIGTKMTPLDKILSVVSVLGVQMYTILGIVVGGSGIFEESEDGSSSALQKRHSMLLAVSIIQLLQIIMQNTFIAEGIRRTSLSRTQALTRPARQVVTFLIFSNAVLWVFDTFVIQSWMSQELQLRFFGVLAWGALSRIGLPLLVFFRFHSCVLLLEIWKKSYRSLPLDSGN